MQSKRSVCRILSLINSLRLDFELNITLRGAEDLLTGRNVIADVAGKPDVKRENPGCAKESLESKKEQKGPGWQAWKKCCEKYTDELGTVVMEKRRFELLNVDSLSGPEDNLNLILIDLLTYDNQEFVETVFNLLMERAQHMLWLTETIRKSQVLTWQFAPFKLICHCMKPEMARHLTDMGIDLTPWAFRDEKGDFQLQIGDSQDEKVIQRFNQRVSSYTNCAKSLELIMTIMGDVKDALESYQATFVGSGDNFLMENLEMLLSLCEDGAENANVMREVFRDGGVFDILEKAAHLITFPSRKDTSLIIERKKKARKILRISMELMRNVISDSESNSSAALPMLDRLFERAKKMSFNAKRYLDMKASRPFVSLSPIPSEQMPVLGNAKRGPSQSAVASKPSGAPAAVKVYGGNFGVASDDGPDDEVTGESTRASATLGEVDEDLVVSSSMEGMLMSVMHADTEEALTHSPDTTTLESRDVPEMQSEISSSEPVPFRNLTDSSIGSLVGQTNLEAMLATGNFTPESPRQERAVTFQTSLFVPASTAIKTANLFAKMGEMGSFSSNLGSHEEAREDCMVICR